MSTVDTAKMHGLDMPNVSSRVKWNLGFTGAIFRQPGIWIDYNFKYEITGTGSLSTISSVV